MVLNDQLGNALEAYICSEALIDSAVYLTNGKDVPDDVLDWLQYAHAGDLADSWQQYQLIHSDSNEE